MQSTSEPQTCRACSGQGKVFQKNRVTGKKVKVVCHRCRGTGQASGYATK